MNKEEEMEFEVELEQEKTPKKKLDSIGLVEISRKLKNSG